MFRTPPVNFGNKPDSTSPTNAPLGDTTDAPAVTPDGSQQTDWPPLSGEPQRRRQPDPNKTQVISRKRAVANKLERKNLDEALQNIQDSNMSIAAKKIRT